VTPLTSQRRVRLDGRSVGTQGPARIHFKVVACIRLGIRLPIEIPIKYTIFAFCSFCIYMHQYLNVRLCECVCASGGASVSVCACCGWVCVVQRVVATIARTLSHFDEDRLVRSRSRARVLGVTLTCHLLETLSDSRLRIRRLGHNG
jgi:hypothetical protein